MLSRCTRNGAPPLANSVAHSDGGASQSACRVSKRIVRSGKSPGVRVNADFTSGSLPASRDGFQARPGLVKTRAVPEHAQGWIPRLTPYSIGPCAAVPTYSSTPHVPQVHVALDRRR